MSQSAPLGVSVNSADDLFGEDEPAFINSKMRFIGNHNIHTGQQPKLREIVKLCGDGFGQVIQFKPLASHRPDFKPATSFDFTEEPLLAEIEILDEELSGGIANGDTLRISLPSGWRCSFDAAEIPTLSGSTAAKIGVPQFTDDNRTLALPVTSDFAYGDRLTINGLRLLNLHLTPPATAALELDYNGDGIRDVYDRHTITIRAPWPGGSYDGWDSAGPDGPQRLKALGSTLIMIR